MPIPLDQHGLRPLHRQIDTLEPTAHHTKTPNHIQALDKVTHPHTFTEHHTLATDRDVATPPIRLHKPSDFDPARQYPLLIDVYGGPLSQSVRNRFRAAESECEYGFLIASIDNRGTRNRGKAFEAAAYMKLGDVDLQDQVLGVKYLCRRPYVDSSRVGIYGHSYGGYMAALALLKFPGVFDVAVAGGTVTDWRNYDTIYTERFMRTPQENPEGYDAGSCLKYVDQLPPPAPGSGGGGGGGNGGGVG